MNIIIKGEYKNVPETFEILESQYRVMNFDNRVLLRILSLVSPYVVYRASGSVIFSDENHNRAKTVALREANMCAREKQEKKSRNKQRKRGKERGERPAFLPSDMNAIRAVLLESETDIHAHRCIGRPPAFFRLYVA